MKRAKNKKEQDLLNELAEKMRATCEVEGVNMHIVAAVTGLNYRTANNLATGKSDVTTSNLLRAIEALGYEVVFVKRKKALRLVDNPDYIARYNEYKLKSNNGTRKKRGQQPLTGNEGPKLKVKRTGISKRQVDAIVSRRSELEKHRSSKDDIFSIT